MVSYFDAYVQEKLNPQILQWQWYKRGMMVMVCFLVTNLTSLSLSFSSSLHVFPSIRGSLFDSTGKYLFWVDKGKIGWLIQQRFPFQDSLGGTR